MTIDILSEASTIETGSSAMISDGFGDQRPGDRDALQLPARELVREAAPDLREREPDLVQGHVGGGLDRPRCRLRR